MRPLIMAGETLSMCGGFATASARSAPASCSTAPANAGRATPSLEPSRCYLAPARRWTVLRCASKRVSQASTSRDDQSPQAGSGPPEARLRVSERARGSGDRGGSVRAEAARGLVDASPVTGGDVGETTSDAFDETAMRSDLAGFLEHYREEAATTTAGYTADHKPRLLWWLDSGEAEARALSYFTSVSLLALVAAGAASQLVTDEEISALKHGLNVLAGYPVALWRFYDASVCSYPIITKAVISGMVYTLGDLTAQTYEGRSIGDYDASRMLRSGLCGFVLHGPVSHMYYNWADHFFTRTLMLDPSSWYLPLCKIAMDQTAWSVTWNAMYYTFLGVLKFESPSIIYATVAGSWWDLLKAGWRLWPFAHIVTYFVIPVQHRLLWVDCVELVWVTILSMYGQEQRERMAEAATAAGVEGAAVTYVSSPLPGADGGGGDAAEEILRAIQSERQVCVEDANGQRVVVDIADVYGSLAKQPDGGSGGSGPQ